MHTFDPQLWALVPLAQCHGRDWVPGRGEVGARARLGRWEAAGGGGAAMGGQRWGECQVLGEKEGLWLAFFRCLAGPATGSVFRGSWGHWFLLWEPQALLS